MNPVTIMVTHATQTIDQQIAWASLPFGDSASLRQREAAAQALLERGPEAHRRIIEVLQSGGAINAPALVALLPRFGLDEAIDALQGLLHGTGQSGLIETAAQALARHPSPRAGRVLLDALAAPDTRVIIAATDALAERAESQARLPLRALRGHADALVRYHAVQAAHRLGALSADDLAEIERRDRDAEVRALAASLLARGTRGEKP